VIAILTHSVPETRCLVLYTLDKYLISMPVVMPFKSRQWPGAIQLGNVAWTDRGRILSGWWDIGCWSSKDW